MPNVVNMLRFETKKFNVTKKYIPGGKATFPGTLIVATGKVWNTHLIS